RRHTGRMQTQPWPSAEYFDGWYADMAASPVKDEIMQRHLGLPHACCPPACWAGKGSPRPPGPCACLPAASCWIWPAAAGGTAWRSPPAAGPGWWASTSPAGGGARPASTDGGWGTRRD